MQSDTSEYRTVKRLQKPCLYEETRTHPAPCSGRVDVNPPVFIWPNSGDGARYMVRISKDPALSGEPFIVSEEQRWTFFIPRQKLEPGTWYWRYGICAAGGWGVGWSEAYTFEITGKERDFLPPPASVLLENIPSTRPRYLAEADDVGRYAPEGFDCSRFVGQYEEQIGGTLPDTLIYNDREVLAEKERTLGEKWVRRFIDKRTKEIFLKECDVVTNFLKCYILTGDVRFQREGLRRYDYMDAEYRLIEEKGFLNDFTVGGYHFLAAAVYDTCYEIIPAEQRERMKGLLVDFQRESFEKDFIHRAELRIANSHLWQHHLRNFYITAVILKGDAPEADEWIAYAYELWVARAPVGSRNDGGWAAGNGYMNVNTETLFLMPYWFSRYTGTDFFQVPWYRGVSSYLAYTSPIGHVSGAFGDMSDWKRENMVPLVQALALATDDPVARWYVQMAETKGVHPDATEIAVRKRYDWFLIKLLGDGEREAPEPELPAAKAFRDVGTAAMHTDMRNPEKNLMVSLRANPFGVIGHGHACQNAFNIQYGGMPVFYRTGYYTSWADAHTLQCYRHTRSHNSVLADGIGQCLGTSGYGWLARFLSGERISYCLGEASQAYCGEVARDEFLEQADYWNVPLTRENGFGDPGVTRFRRHLALLRPYTIVVYDELEAEGPVTWSWLLHSYHEISRDGDRLVTRTERAIGCARLFCRTPLRIAATDRFYSPADDWLGNCQKNRIPIENHWHASADTEEKVNGCRYLAVMQVLPLEKQDAMDELSGADPAEGIAVNGWNVSAELDPSKPSLLSVTSVEDDAGLVTGDGASHLQVGGASFETDHRGDSMLIEQGAETIRKACGDALPDVAVYY